MSVSQAKDETIITTLGPHHTTLLTKFIVCEDSVIEEQSFHPSTTSLTLGM